MKKISCVGKEMLAFQERLASEFGYEPVEPNFFLGDVRQKYKDALPGWCVLNGDPETVLCTLDDTILCKGYNRIVIGDYGAFVEISPEQLCADLRCRPGQEYRYMNETYAGHVKYLWMTARDHSDCKIYLQRKKVSYADYIPGKFYISPYEVDVASIHTR